MEQVTTVGIDLAKKVLCILAMDFNQPSANGKERLIDFRSGPDARARGLQAGGKTCAVVQAR